ncbi:unnamed protein product [Caenorhabditis nigoni]
MNYIILTNVLIFLISSADGVHYTAKIEKSVSESATVLNLFPDEKTWKSATIASDKQIYMESHFSKASYDRECEHETNLIPVYFYPGETIRIECLVCNIALIFNGSPKGWARVRNIDDFMEKGEKFGSNDGPDIEVVQNAEFLEDEKVFPPNGTLGQPYYYQENGFLVIENANALSQGAYFCYDEDSIASQRHFHILLPLVPVVHVAREYVKNIEEISGGCSDSARSYPDHFWLLNNTAEPFDDQDTCFNRYGFDDWSCYDNRKSIRTSGCENPASQCKSQLSFPTLPSDIPISISLRWEPWKECEQRVQTREGHCFVSLDRELLGSDALTDRWEWLKKLNRMNNHIAFREGIPIFSTLLASWLYKTDQLESCRDTELGGNIDGYDTFFKNVFSSIFPNMTEELETPQNAFKYCFKFEKTFGKYNSLLGTHTIDQQAC